MKLAWLIFLAGCTGGAVAATVVGLLGIPPPWSYGASLALGVAVGLITIGMDYDCE